MTRATYLLRTEAGATIMAFDTVEAAQAARVRKQKDFSRPLRIVQQRIVEECVA